MLGDYVVGLLTDNNWKLYQRGTKNCWEKYNVPAVLDPVANGAGEYRKKVADDPQSILQTGSGRNAGGASLVGINVAS